MCIYTYILTFPLPPVSQTVSLATVCVVALGFLAWYLQSALQVRLVFFVLVSPNLHSHHTVVAPLGSSPDICSLRCRPIIIIICFSFY